MKDCVAVMVARMVSVPWKYYRSAKTSSALIFSVCVSTYHRNPQMNLLVCQEPVHKSAFVREHVRIGPLLLSLLFFAGRPLIVRRRTSAGTIREGRM
jgi:hypothetical protein